VVYACGVCISGWRKSECIRICIYARVGDRERQGGSTVEKNEKKVRGGETHNIKSSMPSEHALAAVPGNRKETQHG